MGYAASQKPEILQQYFNHFPSEIFNMISNTISNFLRSKLFEVRKKRLSKGLLEVEMIFILQRLIEAKEVWC